MEGIRLNEPSAPNQALINSSKAFLELKLLQRAVLRPGRRCVGEPTPEPAVMGVGLGPGEIEALEKVNRGKIGGESG